jgi:4-alpha-glucanotransferase
MLPLDDNQLPAFAPDEEIEQQVLGERLVALYAQTGAEVIAEDLGTVPDFVRASLARLDVPGFKVMRWERHWDEPGKPYIDPSDYPPVSVATTGTHDTEPLVTWWESLPVDERRDVLALPSVTRHLCTTPSELDAMVRAVFDSPSYLTIVPVQDLFGWSDRINTPAQVSKSNWSWLLPWRVDRLLTLPEPRARATTISQWTRSARR